MKKYLLMLLFVPVLVAAHGGEVTTQTKTLDGYEIEFEYNSLSNIKVGDVIIYDVHLSNKDDQPVSFDSAYIKISNSKGAPILFGTLKQSADTLGTATIGGIVREAGEHTAQIQFIKDGKQIGPLNFEFTVDAQTQTVPENPKSRLYIYIVAVLASFVLGIVVGFKLVRINPVS